MADPGAIAQVLPLAAAAAGGYVLGSLPFGFWVARSRGVNIFEVGSKSPGATNVRRVLGAGPGRAVFALDTAKGAAAAGWPLLAFALAPAAGWGGVLPASRGLANAMGYVGLALAILGHSFSCFTGFRGGKGVATAAGGLFVLLPVVALVSAAVWSAIFFTTRYVSLASILAALCLPAAALLTGRPAAAVAVTALVALFVVVRHRANVGRLLSGTERKFERRRPDGAAGPGKP